MHAKDQFHPLQYSSTQAAHAWVKKGERDEKNVLGIFWGQNFMSQNLAPRKLSEMLMNFWLLNT